MTLRRWLIFASGAAAFFVALAIVNRLTVVSGVVVDAQGRPRAGVKVELLTRASPPTLVSVQSDASGNFALTRSLLAQEWSLHPSGPGLLTDEWTKVPRWQLTPLVVRIAGFPTISGRAIDDAGRPVSGALVKIWQLFHGAAVHWDIDPASVSDLDSLPHTNPDGTFSSAVSPNLELAVEIVADDSSALQLVEPQPVDRGRDIGTITLPRGWPVSGRLLDSRDKIVAGATIFSVSTLPGGHMMGWDLAPRQATTDARGEFTFSNLRHDPSEILVSWTPEDGCSEMPISPEARRVEFRRTGAHARLSGRVVDAAGKPIQATISSDPWCGFFTKLGSAARKAFKKPLLTDANGAFSIADPGTHPFLIVESPGYRNFAKEVTPTSGLTIVLERN